MSGMGKGLKDWNYKVYDERITIDLPSDLSIDYFENKINYSKAILLRWAIIKLDANKATINATFLGKEG